MSMPALVPHLRPAGSSPQFLVMFGAGLGRPSPEMKLPAPRPCAASDVGAGRPALHAASSSAAQTLNAGIRVRGLDMTPPHKSIRAHIVNVKSPGMRAVFHPNAHSPRVGGPVLWAILVLMGPGLAASAQESGVLRISVVLTDATGNPTPIPRAQLLISDNPTTQEPRRIRTGADGTVEIKL